MKKLWGLVAAAAVAAALWAEENQFGLFRTFDFPVWLAGIAGFFQKGGCNRRTQEKGGCNTRGARLRLADRPLCGMSFLHAASPTLELDRC